MEFTFKSAVMKVGNSLVVNLPKPVVDVFSIDKGDTVDLMVTEKGIYIPLSAKKETNRKAEELVKRVERTK
jgi:antitoxin component of MazEF toxin-antitoxin module